ncbi:MAG: hypothetical protein ACO1NW_11690 [Chitinophagaceae bacterium]
MNHATTYHIGNDNSTHRKKAKAATQANGQLLRLDAAAERRSRNQERQAQSRTAAPAANGFLKTTFLPKLEGRQTVQACTETEKTEKGFYQSLSQLAGHYGIQPMPTQDYGYPYNIALSLWDIQRKLKEKCRGWDGLRVVQAEGKTFLSCEERYRTGTVLYYIPVVPLFRMLKDPQRKQAAQLLLSVCSYLYHVADVPYYRQECSYLCWTYAMLREWVEQDEATDENDTCLNECRKADIVGDRMEQKIFNRTNLSLFETRLKAFPSGGDTFERDCLRLAQEAYALYTMFPHESIFRNARQDGDDPQDGEDIGMIYMHQYISFFADGKGWLYDRLSDSVNSEFNECVAVEEPCICKPFNGMPVTGRNLDFENRIFPVIERLCYLLNHY